MNPSGLLYGLVTLGMIGLGFWWVVRLERRLGTLWWPYVLACGLGLVVISLFARLDWLSALLGISGASLVWGSTELEHQARRARLGWFPYQEKKLDPPFASLIRRWKAPHL